MTDPAIRAITIVMEMPKVGSEMIRLTELFAGTWRGDEKLYPSEWDLHGGPATGVWTVTPALDGFCLLVDYQESRDGKVAYRGHGVHGWDGQDACFYAYWFDNIGAMPKAAIKATFDPSNLFYVNRNIRT